MKLQKTKSEIEKKNECLQVARKTLKSEYFGIDQTIDKIIDNISSWYLFPEFQQRPHIVNLWGMTGTGKTSLVRRLTALLGMKDDLFSFEMSKGSKSLEETLTDLEYANRSKDRNVLLFDEFQHLRAFDEDKKYVSNSLAQIVWKVLDTGKFETYPFFMMKNNSYRKYRKLKAVAELGVEVKNGVVLGGKETFLAHCNIDPDDQDNYFHEDKAYMKKRKDRSFQSTDDKNPTPGSMASLRFVSFDLIENLVYMLEDPEIGLSELDCQFQKMNAKQSVAFIEQLMKKAYSPKLVDCSKSLIFICGNLDKAYPMHDYLHPEIDADIFYEESLKVTVSDVKSSLEKFLRLEQISRLGNTHIIYPSLSSAAYKKIIQTQINEFKKNVLAEYEIQLSIDESIEEVIYSEGVYPSQGARPLLSTIKEVLSSKLGLVLGEIYLKDWSTCNLIEWTYAADSFELSYKENDRFLGKKQIPIVLALKTIRDNQEKDALLITSVHEAGHALVYRVLEGICPKITLSGMSSSSTGGLVITANKEFYSKNHAIKKLAIMLGGFSAEKLIFGLDAVTYGSSGDLIKAEFIAREMSNSWGFQLFESSSIYKNSVYRIPEQIGGANQFIEEAFAVAHDILKENQKTLIKISNHLKEKKCLKQDEMEALMPESFRKSKLEQVSFFDAAAYQIHFESKQKEFNEF